MNFQGPILTHRPRLTRGPGGGRGDQQIHGQRRQIGRAAPGGAAADAHRVGGTSGAAAQPGPGRPVVVPVVAGGTGWDQPVPVPLL